MIPPIPAEAHAEVTQNISTVIEECKLLRERSEQDRLDARSAMLSARALAAENELLDRALGQKGWLLEQRERELAALSQELHACRTALGSVPWRIVGVWRKLRPFVPQGIFEAVRRVWRVE